VKARRSGSLRAGFTLLEVVLAMAILALLAASVYAIVGSAIGASRAALEQQLTIRRLDAFLGVVRKSFLNLPSEGTVFLESGKSGSGAPELRLVLRKARGVFGLPSLGGGELVLTAKPRPDGTRAICLQRIPPNAPKREDLLKSAGVELLPGVRKPKWSFFQSGEWKEEWPDGSARPNLIRLEMELSDLPGPIDAVFYLPPLVAPASGPSPSPSPSPSSSKNPPQG